MLKLLFSCLIVLVFASACTAPAPGPEPMARPPIVAGAPGLPAVAETSPKTDFPVAAPHVQPKLGLILGPGGAKALAHLGVLKELERSRIPVTAVVGLEWGALVGGLYAQKGLVHDVEWKIFKLEGATLPGKGLLSSKVEAEPVSDLRKFLSESFQAQRLDRFHLPFACPTISLSSGRRALMTAGVSEGAMERCLPFPPLFKSGGEWVADMFSLEGALNFLRSKGVTVVLISDVLGTWQANPLPDLKKDEPSGILWLIAQEGLRRETAGSIVWVTTETRPFALHEFGKRAELVSAGEKATVPVVNRLKNEFGF